MALWDLASPIVRRLALINCKVFSATRFALSEECERFHAEALAALPYSLTDKDK